MRKLLRISESSAEFGLSMPTKNHAREFTFSNCFNVLNLALSKTFYKIGYIVGKYPSYFLIVPFFISILGLSGFQRIHLENDSEFLFIPSDSNTKVAINTLETLFPTNSSHLFDPTRIARAKYFAKLYIRAKDGGTMFRRNVWEEVVLLDKLVQNITVEWDGKDYRYQEMCGKWQGQCFENNIYRLNDLIPEMEDNKMWISYPINLFPLILPMFFGGVEVNKTDGVMESAKAVFTTYWLAKDDWKQKER